ncbi:MAG: HD family phosphohydrolase, partial [Bdellovibrio sp.]|nr:HD family phosphohydrolase [Bdellovibrio sp.]
RDICKHIILSHHGKLEYGSPKRPKFLEAMVVAMVDDFDSKVSTLKTVIDSERGSGEKWSRYSDLFDRYFLLEDLNEKF